MRGSARIATVVAAGVLAAAGCARPGGSPPTAVVSSPSVGPVATPTALPAATPPAATQLLAGKYDVSYDFISPTLGWAFVAERADAFSPAKQPPPFWVFKTTDGAASWHEQLTGSIALFIAGGVQFFDAMNGILYVGAFEKSQQYRTADGGAHWTAFAIPDFTIRVSFADTMHGWAYAYPDLNSGKNPDLLVTSDGGKTWSMRSWSADAFWPGNGVVAEQHFRLNGEGWFGGLAVRAKTYSTSDGGVTWRSHTIPIASGLYPTPSVQDPEMDVQVFLLPQSGVLASVGGYGTQHFFSSFDRGASWKVVVSPPNATPYTSYLYVDDQNWWAMGAGSLFKTSDAGQTWKRIDTPLLLDNWIYSPHLIDATHAWARLTLISADANTALVMSSDGGVIWKPVNVPQPTPSA